MKREGFSDSFCLAGQFRVLIVMWRARQQCTSMGADNASASLQPVIQDVKKSG